DYYCAAWDNSLSSVLF
nr:immunoglobulin light chain junction region [Macaca mulatta]MOW16662.1 immunoglobulin light chain junction region [Macaca mulatta]MOW18106.1 immunoglobulin light chain junction region [Macaca mulatta]MOW18277.1 immunoglobulin light chain junction region [Macaca mulatta]MOW72461.1 immunoglobulin light chain junction region [Macaca mulatta]